jgi:hypothetical protein
MSGTPKCSRAELDRQRQQQLEEERRRQAAEEARLRAEAAEKLRLQRVESRKNVGEIQEILAGLKADPVVMCWHPHSVSELEQELKQAFQALDSDRFDVPSQILAKVKEKEKKMVDEANVAQLKADQRDYITQSIVATLQEMGFGILSIEEEHRGHPSTAKTFTATAAGRAISVSVPVKGEVWYDVDGYSKSTVASVADGSPASICDEAENVLTEMHSALQQEFGIHMGEISWQGKDPKRITREANDLSTDIQKSRGRSS